MKKVLKERSAQALALLTGMITFFVTSCSPALGSYCENRNAVSSSSAINTIASKVYELDAAGAFDQFRQDARSAGYGDELSEQDVAEMEKFISSPVDYLTSQPMVNDSPEQLDLLVAIYSEATVDEVIEKMEAVSTDMAEEYKANISDFYEELDENARAAVDNQGGIGEIRLTLFPTVDTLDERGVFDPIDFTWGSIWIYVGCSVASIAGMVCYTSFRWLPWVCYPALGVCIASTAGMLAIVYKWRDSTEFKLLKELTLSIVNAYTKISGFVDLSDAKKRELFLTEIYDVIEAAKASDSANLQTYERVLIAIDKSALDLRSFFESACGLLNYCWNDGDAAARILTVTGATIAVGVVSWLTGTAGSVITCWNKIKSFIPDIVILTKIGVSLATIQ